jgi:hypothetical protein
MEIYHWYFYRKHGKVKNSNIRLRNLNQKMCHIRLINCPNNMEFSGFLEIFQEVKSPRKFL